MRYIVSLLKPLFLTVLFYTVNPVKAQYNYYDIATTGGNYAFSYNKIPENIVSANPSATGAIFQWEKSNTPVNGFVAIAGATASTYSFTAPLAQTCYFRRKALTGTATVYSNTVKIEVVSVNWEDLNYSRVHTVLIPSQTDWKAIDGLPIGQKLQTTSYSDGIGRPLQQISKETATPSSGTLWGDQVKFYQYDALGRQARNYLPYTTTTEPGKYKSDPVGEQAKYYSAAYNESSPFYTPGYDNSPLNKIVNTKKPGTSWAASAGISTSNERNDINENVQQFSIGYTPGAAPVSKGAYAAGSLYKIKSTDEHNKQVIEYYTMSGLPVLKKVQVDNTPSLAHSGWICTYSVYDDFGLLRYRIQPEAVKWLDNNSWSFTGSNGQLILNEMCFRYEYDAKGRIIVKKAPGAKELYMLYDNRDRVVFMQDGNQRVKTPAEWTVNIYDELDRPIITALYQTAKSIAVLQSGIDNAPLLSTVSITAQGITMLASKNPVSNTELNTASICTIVSYQFYDDYNYPGAKPFNTAFDNAQAYASGADPVAASKRAINMPTGSKVRVLGTATFLSTTIYYDEKGRMLQATEDNIKGGSDVTTRQYQFDGRLLSSNKKHTAANTGYTNFSIITKNNFDKIGRITSIEKKYGSNPFKLVASYDLDDMGRLQKKHLDPSYGSVRGASDLESLAYSYNIHNEITGINKDYALKAPGYTKWAHFFGMYFGYDNRDAVFNNPLLDGHVTGILWNTQGDDAQRKYDFTYDNAGRLNNAWFREKATGQSAWDNASMDFSVTGANGKIDYDLNGNLLFMLQKGILPGNTTPVNADNMQYSYAALSNRLLKVTDNGNLGAANGKLGDFADGTNLTDDYIYDNNGNLVTDLNKNIKDAGGTAGNGIKYNFLDKPEEIRIAGKGTIKIVYDANGNKLQKLFTPENASNTITTTYIDEFVYQGNDLQYINFEEGRVRVMQAVGQNNGYDILSIDGNITLPNNKRGAWDFFVRDYQQNVRMVLTEETHTGTNSCTMETARAANEEPVFGQVDANGVPVAGNEVKNRFPVASIPGQSSGAGWQGQNIGNYVSRIGRLAASQIGPNTLLKVMAGDQLSAAVIYYYKNTVSNTTNNNTILNSLLKSLQGAITGSSATSGTIKAGAANITSQLSSSIPFNSVISPGAGWGTSNGPNAYLSMLFFDERFSFVSEGSIALKAQVPDKEAPPLVIDNIKAPKNGYVYIYVSNESDEMVYFDNLQVTHNRGRLAEENHYYPYGLKIAGISSRKMPDINEGHIDNHYLYNDKELWEEADLDWYDYGFRNYDPQTGRFTQLDPLTDDYPYLTPYQYASCDPVMNIDIDGLEGETALTPATTKTMQNVGVGAHLAHCAEGVGAKVASNSLSLTAKLAVITARGSSDGLLNANTIGLSDYFGGNHLSDYDDPYEQKAYLEGRLGGAAIALAQGATQISSGPGIATSGAVTLGVGTAAGVVVGLHGTGVAATATADIAWATEKLYKLNISSSAASDVGSNSTSAPSTESSSSTNNNKRVIKDIPKGFKQTKKFGYLHGQKVYEYKGRYYSKDVDEHNGGVWKVFKEIRGKLKRIGTADENLNIFKK